MLNVIQEFDLYLLERGLLFSGVIIGGAALNIMQITNRVTKDIDFIDPVLPEEIKIAAKEFILKNPQFRLDPIHWFNNGPISIIRDLPEQWQNRKIQIFKGSAITLFTLGRLDLLRTKLYAYCDRDIDFDDCIAMKPNKQELELCLPWVLQGDGNPFWPQRVTAQFTILKKALGHE